MSYWAFLRTKAPDYSKGFPYPLRVLGSKYNPHLRCFIFKDLVPALFRTREQARAWAHALDEHGIPVRVKVVRR